MRGFKIQECSQKEIVEQVINLVRFDLPELGFDPMKDIQVLASLKDGDAGVHILNEALKNSLNPILENGQSINLGGRWWTVGDRVMQITNDHSKGIFNGEVGTVVEVSVPLLNNNLLGLIRKPSVKVDFIGNEKVYYTGKNGSLSDHDDISEITLSYAATVHKSQGCEFPVMILVAPESHRMLNRNLLYTAITRAKSECIVVGSRKAVQNAIASIDSMKRNTGLMIRLRKKFELREENQYGVSFKQ